MQTLALILAIVSIVSIIALIIVLVILARNVSSHVRKLTKTLQDLKESLEKQISEVEKKIEDHRKNQEQWEVGLRKWVQDQLKGQDLKNELAVQKVATALESVAKSRETMAGAFKALVVTLRAAFRAEKSLLEQPAVPKEPAGSGALESQ